MLRFIYICIFSLIIFSSSCFAAMNLSIAGLSGKLLDNVNTRVALIDKTIVDNNAYFKRYIESEVKKALRALGYYSPKFSYEVKNQFTKQTLVITVSAGQPILVEEVNITILGDGSKDNAFQSLIEKMAPKIGDILNHGTYDEFKKQLQTLAASRGYFNAKMIKHELAVSQKNHQAYWNIDFNTGKRYSFGEIHITSTQIQPDYLTNLIPFKTGDNYDLNLISILNTRLSSTNWFNSVIISPDFSKMQDNTSLPINIITTPRKKNNYDLGIGFSSDSGLNGKISWNKPWINSQGHSLQSSLLISQPEKILAMSYKIPIKQSPLTDYYAIQTGFKKIDDNDTNSDLYTFGIIRNWIFDTGWQAALGANFIYDDFIQADTSYITRLYYPSLRLFKMKTDGNTLVMHGFFQSYALETAAKALSSDIDFVRMQIQHSLIQSINQSHRFILRNNLSFILADMFDKVPPSLRFFAGGDRSIRGYDYQAISPRDNNGKLIGASKLITASAEYQYNITGNWWGAAFIDSGKAINHWEDSDFYTGAGLGIRWASPVGPIKVDLAVPINRPKEIRLNSIHLYIGIGNEL